nr:glutamate--cysteine ligase [Thiobacillaceae bacterium]
MSLPAALPAFSAYGVELEYMIVDRETLSVAPLADRLLRGADGRVVNELERGAMAWSNELTLHLIEVKNSVPDPDLAGLADAFQAAAVELDRRLAPL